MYLCVLEHTYFDDLIISRSKTLVSKSHRWPKTNLFLLSIEHFFCRNKNERIKQDRVRECKSCKRVSKTLIWYLCGRVIPQLECLMNAGTQKALWLAQILSNLVWYVQERLWVCVCTSAVCVSMLALYTQGKHRVEKMWTMSLNYTSEDIGDTALPVMHHLKAAMELIRVTTNDS